VLERSLDPIGNPSEHPLSLTYLNSKFETGIRSPLDSAILRCQVPDTMGYDKCDEIPFDFERRRLSIVVEKQTEHLRDGHRERLLITKGAPEGILALSTAYETDGQANPLDQAAREHCQSTYRELSAQGFRVLAVAHRANRNSRRLHGG
jgi:P-type Mg2+ transporter